MSVSFNKRKPSNVINHPYLKHHTAQLCNFYIGADDQPKNKKNKNKITLILNTILHNYATSTLDYMVKCLTKPYLKDFLDC